MGSGVLALLHSPSLSSSLFSCDSCTFVVEGTSSQQLCQGIIFAAAKPDKQCLFALALSVIAPSQQSHQLSPPCTRFGFVPDMTSGLAHRFPRLYQINS